MYIDSTIHPYHSIEKSKVQQNQPFLNQFVIIFVQRIERGKGRERKEERNRHNIVLSTNQPKIQTISICKRSPNYWNSKIRRCLKRIFLNSNSRDYVIRISISKIPFIWYIWSFSYLLNSKNRHFFQNFRFVYFQEYFLFLKLADFWNSNSWDYLVRIPIFGIPFILELHLYQYLAIRVKCEIAPWYLEIPNFSHSVCFSSPTLNSLDPQIFNLHCLFYRI